MKTNILVLFLSAATFMVFASCNSKPVYTKEQYISRFENFVAATEKNYMDYDDQAWENADEEFTNLRETEYKRFEKELNSEEQVKIDKLIGQYYSFVAIYKAKQVQNKLKRIYNQAESFFDNISK
jgi:hypothetical protein